MEVSQKPFARKTPDQLVYLELGSGNGGMLLSVSEEGFRFRAVSPLRPIGLVPFAFSFDGTRRLQGVGEIEWLDDDAKSGGMRFAEVSDEFRTAVNQWLATPSRQSRSGREVTADPSVPLDTMEKIREELRRGYSPSSRPPQPVEPARPPQPVREDLTAESRISSARKEAVLPAAQPGQQEKPEPNPESSKPLPTPELEIPVVERKPVVAETPRTFSPPTAPPRTGAPAGGPPQTPLRPHFSQPADEPPVVPLQAKASSPRVQPEAPVSLPPPAAADIVPPAPRELDPPIRAATVPVIPDAAGPHPQFRAPTTLFAAPARPHIPPIDESFDAAWERAKLLTPLEPPHLSRATASSIIGLALAVILGAFAINFRQDIGATVVELGQRISGGSVPASPPADGTSSRSEAPSAPGAGSAGSDKNTESKPESAAATQNAPAQSVASANGRGTPQPGSDAKPPASASSAKHGSPASTMPSAAPNSETSTDSVSTTKSLPRTSVVELPPSADEEPQSAQDSGSGQEEFAAARELLRGVHRKQDLSRAVDLLWAGVRKGYVPAEVTLADLYRRGDGVEKNCDQAQVLLVAASKKGSPDARHLLEQMAEEGCE